MIKETHPFNSKQEVDNLNKDDKTRPTTRGGFQRSLWGKERWEGHGWKWSHLWNWEYRYERDHIDKIGQMINFKTLMTSQMCLAWETSRT